MKKYELNISNGNGATWVAAYETAKEAVAAYRYICEEEGEVAAADDIVDVNSGVAPDGVRVYSVTGGGNQYGTECALQDVGDISSWWDTAWDVNAASYNF